MKIKQEPKDFIVKEIARLSLDGGKFSYFKLRKKQWNTMDAAREIAKRLGINERRLSFAGIKDKQAVTEQYISVENIDKINVEGLGIKDIELEYAGSGDEKMNTDLLVGNEFSIIIRDLDKGLKEVKFLPNYFDEQRFGINGTNHLVGRFLVKKDFGEACKVLGLGVEKNDYIGALLRNKKLLKLCFHAYQSFLFNEVLAEYVRKHYKAVDVRYCAGKLAFAELTEVKNFSLPLVHFDAEFEGELKILYEKVLEKEGIRLSDFLIRQLPNLIQVSPMRLAFVAVKDFKIIEFSDDELNSGKKRQVVSFSLPKGSYATLVIKAMKAL
jgi:tRNA pseudouridine13 synthase